jgi:hypothetical protein
MPIPRSPASPLIDRTKKDRYQCNAATGPIVYGDKRPGRFLEDVSKGNDSLDIIVISDSNACSSFQIGSYGWTSGIPAALDSLNMQMYGTGLCYTHHRGTQGSAGFYGQWRATFVTNTATSGGANNTLGSGSSVADAVVFQSFWNNPALRTGYASIEATDYADWTFAPNTAADLFSITGIIIDQDHPLANTGLTVKYRGVFGKTTTGTGRIFCNVWQRGPINAQPRTTTTPATAVSMTVDAGTPVADRISALEWSFTPPSTQGYTVGPYGANGVADTFTRGPFALLGHSVYTARKGWAVHTHHHGSGQTSAQISTATANTAAKARLQAELKEMRERQQAAGGSGRVMIFWNSGINGPDTGAVWTASMLATWNNYKSVWASLGYPLGDLCIVACYTFPFDTVANENAIAAAARAAANLVPGNNPDVTVIDLGVATPYKYLAGYYNGGIPLYQSFGNYPYLAAGNTLAHLSGGPCGSGVSGSVGSALAITGASPVTTSTSITLTGAAAVAQDNYWTGGTVSINAIGGNFNSPAGQDCWITAYNGTTKVATVAWSNGQQPTGQINYTLRKASHSDGYGAVSRVILTSLMSAT